MSSRRVAAHITRAASETVTTIGLDPLTPPRAYVRYCPSHIDIKTGQNYACTPLHMCYTEHRQGTPTGPHSLTCSASVSDAGVREATTWQTDQAAGWGGW